MELSTKNAVKTFKSDGIITSKMGVDTETSDLLTYYLRDKIYSDKILAPIREYICNAWDAHIESGNTDKYVEITTSKFGSSYQWSVRDYGYGLDEDDVRNVFGIYGKSTKRNSNKLVGTFGVGAMSAFSYTDTFYVTSYYNGTKTTYVCALGAGDYGVEVGEIHKMSEEPTTETGVEICFDITKDVGSFDTKTSHFVSWFDPAAKVRFTTLYGHTHTPFQPNVVRKSDVDGVVFSQYDNGRTYSNIIEIRMGGVIYSHFSYDNVNGTVVVDIPIGSMTIPISREGFEDNPSNNKYLDKLKNEVTKLYKDDVSNLPPMTLLEFMKNVQCSKSYKTDFFILDIRQAYPELYEIDNGINMSIRFVSKKHEVLEKFPIVYVIPNIKSQKSWHRRLANFLKTPTVSEPIYCWVNSDDYNTLGLATKDNTIINVAFLNVKDMKLPELQSSKEDKKQYLVTRSGYNRSNYYSFEELEEHVNKDYPIDWDSLTTEFWNKPDINMSELYARTIGTAGLPYGAWRCNSQKFVDKMVEIGWVEYGSDDYKAATDIIKENERKARQKDNMRYYVDSHKLNKYWNPKTRDRIMKNWEKNSARMDKLLNSLQTRKTTIMEKMVRQYVNSLYGYSTPILNRQEFRKLLTTEID